ncbi:MAG: hypothetical protein H0X13_20400 [Ramlibacter sp.]|nr:hypothetical protein [Ramlibacter sp.]
MRATDTRYRPVVEERAGVASGPTVEGATPVALTEDDWVCKAGTADVASPAATAARCCARSSRCGRHSSTLAYASPTVHWCRDAAVVAQ